MKELYAKTFAECDGMVRFFLLTGDKRALLIDTGMSGLDVRGIAAARTDLPLALLNTHADRDHIASNGQFDEFYMHPSEAAIYRNVLHGHGKILPVFDGDTIDLGGRVLEILHLPGHTPGSITVLDRQNRCLIGGDPIQEDGEIFMFGQHRDLEAYIAGLKRLDARDDFDCIYPSHAKEKVDRSVIPRLIEGAEAILEGKIKGVEREMFGKKIAVYDVGVSKMLCEAL